MAERLAIIGGGWAGMAAAVELASHGQAVEVFEASRTLGGRARAVKSDGWVLDNGVHILSGAYHECLRLMHMVGSEQHLRRLPLTWSMPGLLHLAAPRRPAPWPLAIALLTAQGLSWREKWAALRFLRAMRRQGFALAEDCPVDRLLAAQSQPARLGDVLWRPLCLAALNTPAAQASARAFLRVLRDALAGGRAESDLLLPTVDLSALFPEPAAAWLTARGGRVYRQRRIRRVMRDAAGFWLDGDGPYTQVIIAVAPWHLPPLLENWPSMSEIAQQAARLPSAPITTLWLAYPAQMRLPQPMIGLLDGHAQWLFDRGALGGPPGLLAAVISADGPHGALADAALVDAVHRQIARVLPGVPPPAWSRVMRIKRATFACRPDVQRPPLAMPVPGLWLAGDYVAGDYPATLEGAVKSGLAAAHAALAAAGHGKSA